MCDTGVKPQYGSTNVQANNFAHSVDTRAALVRAAVQHIDAAGSLPASEPCPSPSALLLLTVYRESQRTPSPMRFTATKQFVARQPQSCSNQIFTLIITAFGKYLVFPLPCCVEPTSPPRYHGPPSEDPRRRVFFRLLCRRPSSVVEHSLGKGEVEGSSPLGGFR